MNQPVCHVYPAVEQSSPSSLPLVLLHGWASDSRCWQWLLPELNRNRDIIAVDLPGFGDSAALSDDTPEIWLQALLSALPEQAIYLGWSLGGMLAVQLAAHYPERVAGVCTLASNLKFVAERKVWPCAMPVKVEQNFYRDFSEAPEKTLKMFAALQAQGDLNERALIKQLRALLRDQAEPVNDGWQVALRLLARLDNRELLAGLAQPGLHLLGDGDALVPAAVADSITSLIDGENSSQRVQVLPDCGHAPHISQPQRVLEPLQTFLAQWS